jgi:AsmA-like C-terminal region/AsmA family
MSDTYIESVARATKPLVRAPAPARRWTRWPKLLILILVLLWLATEAMSLAIQHTRLQKKLTARLEAAFGRPVEVGSYELSLWGGPVLEARSLTVAEDPRFGQEYFLRADSMSVRLRWQSLLRGSIELGTLSLTSPSLNLVRNVDGDWNLAEWLPRPADVPGAASAPNPAAKMNVGPSLPVSPLRFRRIEVSGGRINFKQGDDKFPFAFVDVSGTVETDRPGRWRMNLEATPWRAAIVLQQAGTIHFSGDVGGISSRLRPAALDATWTNVSVSDMLRMARSDDYGVRGSLEMALNARTQENGDGWAVQGRAELSQIHRWDLALRSDNPSVNLIAHTVWHPEDSDLDPIQLSLEAPHSAAQLTGKILWNSVAAAGKRPPNPVQLTLAPATIDMMDLLAWVRAFHPGVANDLSVRGLATARADFSAWPLSIANAAVSSEGVDVSGGGLPETAHLGSAQVHFDRGAISFSPATLAWGAPAAQSGGSFRFDLSPVKPARNAPASWHISGTTRQVGDLVAGAGAFGWNISRGWDLAGPFACDLRWPAAVYPWSHGSMAQSTGWMEFGSPSDAQPQSQTGAALHAPFLNLPVEQIKARAELKPGSRHITLAAAQAFGAHWTGTFDRSDPAGDWQFALSADRLAAADLDRWLNPAWRESFLDRMLPFLNSRPLESVAPESLRAAGRLTLDQFALAPLVVRHLQGTLKVDGRSVELSDATGQFFGGMVGGSLTANLDSAPTYHADLNFSRVDVPSLVAATPTLAGLTAESAAGQIAFDAQGSSRSDLLASLTCQGNVRANGLKLLNVDVSKSLGGLSQDAGATRFPGGFATFSCTQRKIQFQKLSLASSGAAIAEGSGTIDFSRNLDLQFRVRSGTSGSVDQPATGFRLTGSLASPQVTSTPSRSAKRSR